MINVGIIGFGKMGQIRADAISQSGRGEVVCVFDPYQSVDEYPTVDSQDAVIQDDRVEAVFICTPNYLNQPLTLQGLEAGKHVFCEKPPALSAKDLEPVRAAENASCKHLMYGFNHRHHTSVKHMKTLIDSGEYGEVLWMRGRYGKSVDPSFANQWRANPELSGGGILIDQGIHMVDLLLHLGGEFDEVKAFVSSLYWQMEIEDNVFAILRNTSTGAVASLHSTMTQWRHLFSLEVFLSRGYLVLNGLKTSSGTYGDEVLSIAKNRTTAPAARWEDEEHITYHENTSWRSEIDHFFDAIEHEGRIEVGNSTAAMELMKTIDLIYEQG